MRRRAALKPGRGVPALLAGAGIQSADSELSEFNHATLAARQEAPLYTIVKDKSKMEFEWNFSCCGLGLMILYCSYNQS